MMTERDTERCGSLDKKIDDSTAPVAFHHGLAVRHHRQIKTFFFRTNSESRDTPKTRSYVECLQAYWKKYRFFPKSYTYIVHTIL